MLLLGLRFVDRSLGVDIVPPLATTLSYVLLIAIGNNSSYTTPSFRVAMTAGGHSRRRGHSHDLGGGCGCGDNCPRQYTHRGRTNHMSESAGTSLKNMSGL